MIAIAGGSVGFSGYERALPKFSSLDSSRFGVLDLSRFEGKSKLLGFFPSIRLGFLPPLKALEVCCLCCRGNQDFQSDFSRMVYANGDEEVGDRVASKSKSNLKQPSADCNAVAGTRHPLMSTIGKSTNIVWQECSVGNLERQTLLQQKGCVIWITGLSGSGKSTLACALSRQLHSRGKLSYILDGDNLRHGLNRDLGFKAEDRAENIRRVGEVAKLFADAGVICIASLISPYRRDRDACRSLLPEANFIEVFMNIPLEVCEARDSKGLYKLARAGKIKGFTGVDDPYEPPLNCEIIIQQKDGVCSSPCAMAEQVMSYLEENGFLL